MHINYCTISLTHQQNIDILHRQQKIYGKLNFIFMLNILQMNLFMFFLFLFWNTCDGKSFKQHQNWKMQRLKSINKYVGFLLCVASLMFDQSSMNFTYIWSISLKMWNIGKSLKTTTLKTFFIFYYFIDWGLFLSTLHFYLEF